MAILTISRQMGSRGDEISEQLASHLGYELIDKAAIHKLIASEAIDFSDELRDIAEESQPRLLNRLFRHQAVYVNLVSALVYEAVGEDNVIIKGRGGQFLLTNRPNVLNVRFIAPLKKRAERLEQTRHLDPEIAEEFVRRADHDREAFIQYLYRADVNQSEWYDVIINTGKFDNRSIIEIISHKLSELDAAYPMSDAYRNRFKALALRKRVEAVLQKQMPNSNHIRVEADTDGTVRISGYIGTDVEKSNAEEVALSVRGVTSLVNKIHVAHFPVTTWP